MNTMAQVKQHLAAIPPGKPFSMAECLSFGSYANIRQAFTRLVKQGDIKRLVRGIFVKPKVLPIVGETLPSSVEVVQSLAEQTGEIIAEHGAEAARRLQLTTQVPLHSIFYTSGTTRTLQYGKQQIVLQHVSPKIIAERGTLLGTVISALWYLGKESVSNQTIAQLKAHLGTTQFLSLLEQCQKMPVWIANRLQTFQQQSES